jgi:hypothetical protein
VNLCTTDGATLICVVIAVDPHVAVELEDIPSRDRCSIDCGFDIECHVFGCGITELRADRGRPVVKASVSLFLPGCARPVGKRWSRSGNQGQKGADDESKRNSIYSPEMKSSFHFVPHGFSAQSPLSEVCSVLQTLLHPEAAFSRASAPNHGQFLWKAKETYAYDKMQTVWVGCKEGSKSAVAAAATPAAVTRTMRTCVPLAATPLAPQKKALAVGLRKRPADR